MNVLVYFYIILYISYIILGPHYITRYFRGEKLKIAASIEDVGRRIIYFSYIALLYNAYYFYNPNAESFIVATLINLFAVTAYAIKWYDERNDKSDYYYGIAMHFILIFPVVLSLFYYNIEIKNFRFNRLSQFSLIFIIIYMLFEHKIYKNTGVKFSNLIF